MCPAPGRIPVSLDAQTQEKEEVRKVFSQTELEDFASSIERQVLDYYSRHGILPKIQELREKNAKYLIEKIWGSYSRLASLLGLPNPSRGRKISPRKSSKKAAIDLLVKFHSEEGRLPTWTEASTLGLNSRLMKRLGGYERMKALALAEIEERRDQSEKTPCGLKVEDWPLCFHNDHCPYLRASCPSARGGDDGTGKTF